MVATALLGGCRRSARVRPTVAESEPEAAAWTTFTSNSGGFSVEFPGTPSEQAQVARPEKGEQKIPVVVYEVKTSSATFRVYYAEYSADDLTGETPAKLVEEAVKTATDPEMGRKLRRERPIELAGHAGRDLEIEEDDGDTVIHLRIFPAGRRLYHVMAVVRRRNPVPEDVTRFLDSFHFLPR